VQERMHNPAVFIPEAMQGIQALMKASHRAGVTSGTLDLVHLRVSQINDCSSCVQSVAAAARKAGENEDRLATVAAWREAPFFTDAERAALALVEAGTRGGRSAGPGAGKSGTRPPGTTTRRGWPGSCCRSPRPTSSTGLTSPPRRSPARGVKPGSA
jgi:AhpD family alkylhydroperoxidase